MVQTSVTYNLSVAAKLLRKYDIFKKEMEDNVWTGVAN